MPKRRCPVDTTLEENVCFYDCQATYEPDLEDAFQCVKTGGAPLGFVLKEGSNSVIIKNEPTPTEGGCEPGFTEWVYGQCYINCPPHYADAGTYCVKIAMDRDYIHSTCPGLYYAPNGSTDCILTPWGITLYVLLFAVASLMIYQFSRAAFGWGNSQTLNQVQAYLRKQHGVSSVSAKTIVSTVLFFILLIAIIATQG
jgi:hypothetical protein